MQLTLAMPALSLYGQARQLESLIRMAEARARLELQQIVTAQHAQVGSSSLAFPPGFC